ncbi:MAG TPA: MoxR family ATPase [Candidatus Ozemobacteraceae bacterium]|nr:MoxR family ATPase [Candidatus Ozemobacteraceae bacterium]HQG28401.1 MoxR family ATPase [Candidatus Ozemobacteraceae bacterium]
MLETKATAQEQQDIAALSDIRKAREQVLKEIGRVFIGQNKVVEEVLYALFARGHVLLIGVPGLGKTLLVNTLAKLLDLNFRRIQFTPDLMPTDIIGTEILEEDQTTRERRFRFVQGPLFTQILLADEINRTPPKTQAALLQSMQEYSVTSGGKTYQLDAPFFVLATQNPIEQEGTYPLPEAQLDRFMFNVRIEYPPMEEEVTMVKATTGGSLPELKPVLSRTRILELQDMVRRVPVSDRVVKYAVSVAEATRPKKEGGLPFVNDFVTWGAGPRASQYLVLAGKARAVLQGRSYVSIEDVRALAYAVLRHRVLLNFNAEAEGINTDVIIERILAAVAEPRE